MGFLLMAYYYKGSDLLLVTLDKSISSAYNLIFLWIKIYWTVWNCRFVSWSTRRAPFLTSLQTYWHCAWHLLTKFLIHGYIFYSEKKCWSGFTSFTGRSDTVLFLFHPVTVRTAPLGVCVSNLLVHNRKNFWKKWIQPIQTPPPRQKWELVD